MFLGNNFGKTLDMLHRSMDVSLLRRSVIADNIANADTPNFKRSEVAFEAELKKAINSEKTQGLKAKMTDKRHIPFDRSIDYRTVKPKRLLDYLSDSKNNGNNVDLEQEMMGALNNQLKYQIMVQAAANQFSQINMVLR